MLLLLDIVFYTICAMACLPLAALIKDIIMINRNKFAKLDYVVTATNKNPAYSCGKYTTIVFVVIIVALTCINL